MTSEKIQQLIFDALVMVNHAREDNNQIPIGPETALFGDGGYLDSLGLVGLLIDLEESLQDEGVCVTLSDDRAMSQQNSPFRDVPSLTNYIASLIGNSE